MKRIASSVLAVTLLFGGVTTAQNITVEPTVEVTAEPTPEVTPVPPGIELPDLDPVVDEVETGLNVFLIGAGTVMALAAWVIVQVGKYVFPERVLDTRQIHGIVVGAFSILYLFSTWAGVETYVQRGIDLLTALSGPALQILVLLFGSSLFYIGARKLHIPFLGQPQGKGRLELAEPKGGKVHENSFPAPDHALG